MTEISIPTRTSEWPLYFLAGGFWFESRRAASREFLSQ